MADLISNLSAILKEDYRDAIIEELNNDTPILNQFSKGDAEGLEVAGKYVVYPVHLGRNTGAGSAAEGDTLPVAGNQTFVDVNIYYKYTYGRFQVSRPLIKASAKSRGAFKKAMDIGMSGLVKDVSRVRNRELFGNGTGVLAKVAGTQTTSATLTIKDAGGVPYNDSNGNPIGAGRYFQPNDYVIFVRKADPTAALDADIVGSAVAMKISSISSDLNTLTFSATTGITLNDGDLIVMCPGQVATQCSINKEPMGLLGIIDDGTYLTTLHNISRSTYSQWKGTVRTINGNLDLDQLQRAEDLAIERSGKSEKLTLFSHYSIMREYKKQLLTVKRYVNDYSMKPDAGFNRDLAWGDHPWKEDRMCPYGMIFGVDAAKNVRYVNDEGGWVDDDGTTILRVANQDSYEARWAVYDNFINDEPAGCFRMDGITASVDVTGVV